MFDTVVMCSITALMIVVSGVWDDGFKDISMASAAFAGVFSWFPYVLAVAVVLFAYSTLIAWGYYGGQAWAYLFGPQCAAPIRSEEPKSEIQSLMRTSDSHFCLKKQHLLDKLNSNYI